jgi:hypothetical protein
LNANNYNDNIIDDKYNIMGGKIMSADLARKIKSFCKEKELTQLKLSEKAGLLKFIAGES